MHEPAAETIGYKNSVLFPVEVVPKDPSQPVALALALEFGVCREICIPAEAKFSLTLPPSGLSGTPVTGAAGGARASVPRRGASRRAGDPQLKRATAALEGAAPRLTIVARFPRGGQRRRPLHRGAGRALRADGEEAARCGEGGEARPEADAGSGLVRFEVDLARTGNAARAQGQDAEADARQRRRRHRDHLDRALAASGETVAPRTPPSS